MTAPGPLGLTIVTFPYLSPAGGLTPDPDPEPEDGPEEACGLIDGERCD